jgi:hypothetical protein
VTRPSSRERLGEDFGERFGEKAMLRQQVAAASVFCSEGLLRQALRNLVENGVKYRRDEVKPEIDVSGRVATDHYELRVSDNGMGMATEGAAARPAAGLRPSDDRLTASASRLRATRSGRRGDPRRRRAIPAPAAPARSDRASRRSHGDGRRGGPRPRRSRGVAAPPLREAAAVRP